MQSKSLPLRALSVLSLLFLLSCEGCEEKKQTTDGKEKSGEVVASESVAAENTVAKNENGYEEILRIDNVKKVFIHTPGGYSVIYENSDTRELTHSNYLDLNFYAIRDKWSNNEVPVSQYYVHTAVKLFNDAPPDKGWMIIRCYNVFYYEIHVHTSVDSLTGGDYSYKSGKHYRTGTTRTVN